MTLLLLALAQAAETERYPRSVELTLPDGPVRLRLPLDARTPWDPGDGTDLLLVDAKGDAIPFARAEGEVGSWSERPVVAIPTGDPNRFVVDARDERLDRVDVRLPAGVVIAWVSVERDGEVIVSPTRVYRSADGMGVGVPLPKLGGEFELLVRPRREGAFEGATPSFSFQRFEGISVPSHEVPLPVGAAVLQENGWAVWPIALPRLLPVDALDVVSPERNLQRQAGTSWRLAHTDATSVYEPTPMMDGRLIRKRVGDEVAEEDLRLGVYGEPSDTLELYVMASSQPVPEITGVVLHVNGVDLVVPDPGQNPHTLYVGALHGTSPTWDLGTASEIVRGSEPVLAVPGTAPNPAWVPPETRADVVAPGAALEPTPWRWARSVEGEGLVRIPLPAEVMASARPDLGDLRLVTADRQQIPYVIRGVRREVPVALEVKRREVGSETRLRVKLAEESLPGVVLTLTTPSTVFQRDVSVLRDAATPLRRVSWNADGAARPLVIQLFGPVPDEFEIRIENRDNPALELTDPVAVAIAREMVAVIPPGGGARLWYGAPSISAPDYDFARLGPAARGDVEARAPAEAVLGDREAVELVRLRFVDRAMLGGGVGVFAIGLLLLLLDLLRKLPPPPEPAKAPPAPAAAGADETVPSAPAVPLDAPTAPHPVPAEVAAAPEPPEVKPPEPPAGG